MSPAFHTIVKLELFVAARRMLRTWEGAGESPPSWPLVVLEDSGGAPVSPATP